MNVNGVVASLRLDSRNRNMFSTMSNATFTIPSIVDVMGYTPKVDTQRKRERERNKERERQTMKETFVCFVVVYPEQFMG
jgi:hypothetical protein